MIWALGMLLLSLAGAIALPLCCGFSLWWAIPLFIGLELVLHLLFIVSHWIFCLRGRDRETPLEKQLPVGRIGARHAGELVCAYGGVRAQVTGKEKLPDTPFLLVCNHRSLFDPLVILQELSDYNIAFVSKPSNLQIPMVGDIAYTAGFLAINRENDREALKTILQAADYLKRGICSMGIFPEGTRTRTGKLQDFHAGSFKIAQRANVPLVIACVRGTEKASRRLFLRPTKVYLDILETLPAQRVKAMSTRDLAEYSRSKILEVVKE